ncbi:MAG: hypothetical protein M3Y42_06335 [Actinomycetota bacterium]|nr:hypothetical protein [Actinomycetota bacterium]
MLGGAGVLLAGLDVLGGALAGLLWLAGGVLLAGVLGDVDTTGSSALDWLAWVQPASSASTAAHSAAVVVLTGMGSSSVDTQGS